MMKSKLLIVLFGVILLMPCVSCKKEEPIIISVDFGEGKYKEPFRGFLSSHPQWLVATLDWPVLRSLRPDTLVLTKTIELEFNEDAVRSHSEAVIQFVDDSCNRLEGVKVYCNDLPIGKEGFRINASSEPQLVKIAYKIDPLKKKCTETGLFIVSGVELDEVNKVKLYSEAPQSVADWTFSQKIGCPWLLWLVWLIMALIIIAGIIGIVYLISMSCKLIIAKFGGSNIMEGAMGLISSVNNLPENNERGVWLGEKGNSEYVLNKDYRPKNGNSYNNIENKTVKQLGEDLGDEKPSVLFKDGNPIFNKDPGTYDGKPYSVKIEEEGGIRNYLNKEEIIKKKGINITRTKLHNECFNRLANQLGKSVDEVKAFKGDSAAVDRLANKWNCSVTEVWERCGNPNKVQRVWHECSDKRTVQLVPRLYHMVSHTGGIEAVCKDILNGL